MDVIIFKRYKFEWFDRSVGYAMRRIVHTAFFFFTHDHFIELKAEKRNIHRVTPRLKRGERRFLAAEFSFKILLQK